MGGRKGGRERGIKYEGEREGGGRERNGENREAQRVNGRGDERLDGRRIKWQHSLLISHSHTDNHHTLV